VFTNLSVWVDHFRSAHWMIELEACMATQSWMNREYRRELSTHPCGAPVLRVSEVELLLPTFTTWGGAVRMSRTQLHRVGLRPRDSSLVMIFEGSMGLSCSH
jgi:hypothetical protein